MSTITAEDLAKLRIPLASLPGLDPTGLWLYRSFAAMAGTRRVCDGHASQGDAVDAADSSTADRLARWLAARVGLEVGCAAPCWHWHSAMVCWVLGHGRKDTTRTFAQNGPNVEHIVHALADLDPTDTRRLPDGSRYVDRLALALCCIHVGGAS